MVADFGLDYLQKVDKIRSFFAVVNNTKEKRVVKSAIFQEQSDRAQYLILSGTSVDVLGAV